MNPNRLLAFNRWANARTLESLEAVIEENDRGVLLFGHIIGAQYAWMTRVESRELTPEEAATMFERVFPKQLTVAGCHVRLKEINEYMDSVFAGFDDVKFSTVVRYKNLKGEFSESTIEEIVVHLVNHASYHRGQIASHVRASNGKPAQTDMIQFFREEDS